MNHYHLLVILSVLMLAPEVPISVFAPPDIPALLDEDQLCPRLPPLGRVSYKHQEPKLFRRIMQLVENGSEDAPSVLDVVRTFQACLERFHKQAAQRQDERNEIASTNTSSDMVIPIRFAVSPDGETFEVAYGKNPARRYTTRNDLAALARRVTRKIVAQADPSQRDELTNQLWFLWIESYLRATRERYNSYDYASELIEEQAEDRGRSFAVGFEIEIYEGHTWVSEVYDKQLQVAGLLPGDEVVSLDGRAVNSLTHSELQGYWLSLKPFSFTLVVLQQGEPLRIGGESVPMRHSSLSWSVRGKTGYVRIQKFTRDSLLELRRALRRMKTERVNQLILDVRNNPGGMFSSGLVDIFFKPGQTVVSYQDYDAEEATDMEATVEYYGLPTAVLVDRHTASMAETLAAAFQAHNRGPVVGESTWGKGVGQTLYEVHDEGRLHLVNRTYYYPGTRETWSGIGIKPDVEIELDEEARKHLQPYLDAEQLHFDEQWEMDTVLRAAEGRLEEQQ